jgi:hypothetical protein
MSDDTDMPDAPSDLSEDLAEEFGPDPVVPDASDATYEAGVTVPAASTIKTYQHLVQHLSQQKVLLTAFLNVFRNCSFISSHG